MEKYTLVRYHGEKTSDCLYCGHAFSKLAYGMTTQCMEPLIWQKLINRGWLRSGKYCYKPIMDRTCCPQYTIRCRVQEFCLSKSQKKVLKRMRRFLISGTDTGTEIEKWRAKRERSTYQNNLTEDVVSSLTSSHECSVLEKNSGDLACNASSQFQEKTNSSSLIKTHRQKSKENIVIQKEHTDLKKDGYSSNPKNQASLKTLHDMMPHLQPSGYNKKKLEVRTIRAQIGDSDFEATREESHAVYEKYQKIIHGDLPIECCEREWIRFLVSCSLNHDTDGPGLGYGNYHQHYVLDGKIIAVGVIDILPNYVSSVYFYYDPDYGFLSLGVYSALNEIAYTQQLSLQYYNMGSYIHNCRKLSYKVSYLPSDLLCPETYQWVPIDLCLPAVETKKYERLSTGRNGCQDMIDLQCPDKFDFNDLGIMYEQNLMKYDLYKNIRYFALDQDEIRATKKEQHLMVIQKRMLIVELNELKEFVSLVGTECAKQMYIIRNA